jgi:hypothetical protein
VWISHQHRDHLHFPTLKSTGIQQRRRLTMHHQESRIHLFSTAMCIRLNFSTSAAFARRNELSPSFGPSIIGSSAAFWDVFLGTRGPASAISTSVPPRFPPAVTLKELHSNDTRVG